MPQSPLHELHLRLNARFTDFGGWQMPVQYESVLAEHAAVRDRVGVFDVSHLGRFDVSGSGATELVRAQLCNDITGTTSACFEPSIDYVVTKMPRWTFEKFPEADETLTTQMKSVGEAMSIGRTFASSTMLSGTASSNGGRRCTTPTRSSPARSFSRDAIS